MTDRIRTDLLPNLYGKSGNRRSDIERKLNANVQRGTIFSARLTGNVYTIVTAGGTEYKNVSLKEAEMICDAAMSAYNEGVGR